MPVPGLDGSGILPAIIRLALGLFPVLAFLAFLTFLDSYRLIKPRLIVRALIGGCISALVCYALNSFAFAWLGPHAALYASYGAPVVEELAKGFWVVLLIQLNYAGFMLDAAIYGFAVGTGFAVIENITYLPALAGTDLSVWMVRGFGTAIMHGGTMAIFALLSRTLLDRRKQHRWLAYVPGLLLAFLIHELYNFPADSPLAAAVSVLVGMPLLLVTTFWLSERALHRWIGDKLDRDIDTASMIATGQFSESPSGQYLKALQRSFAAEIVADMLCYLHLSMELSARAKGDLLAREAGLELPADPSLAGRLREMKYLDGSLGRAGRLAIAPLVSMSYRDLWEIYRLQDEVSQK